MKFTIPALPAPVNHYVKHSRGRHFKTERALAFEKAFPLFCPKSPIIGLTFSVSIVVYPNIGKRFDVDAYGKQILDMIAKCGLLVSPKGKTLTDYAFRQMVVTIENYDGDPRLEIEIESLQ